MSIGLGLGLIALLLALWAINWASKAANAAERAAAAAEKSAQLAERSALAAKRHAETSDTGGLEHAPVPQEHSPVVDEFVNELMKTWPHDNSAWPLIEQHPSLTDDEVEKIIVKALYLMGHTDHEAKQHATAVVNHRREKVRASQTY